MHWPLSVLACSTALLGLPFLSSCVPYQQYKNALTELQEAKTANDDLLRRYHQELMRRGQGVGGDAAGTDATTDYIQLLERNRQLASQLAGFKDGLSFTKADLSNFAPGEVALDDGGLALGEHLLFSSGVAKLKPGHLPALDTVARLLKEKYGRERIIVEGHTDNQPLVKTKRFIEDNTNLGYLRARAVFKYFQENHGIPESQMVLVSYGFMKPVDPENMNSDEGRRRNRRVVIRRGGEIRSVVSR